jgi:hypothetical protein
MPKAQLQASRVCDRKQVLFPGYVRNFIPGSLGKSASWPKFASRQFLVDWTSGDGIVMTKRRKKSWNMESNRLVKS